MLSAITNQYKLLEHDCYYSIDWKELVHLESKNRG